MNEEKRILNKIGQIIFDKKGSNILALNVKGISSITDYVLIAEGSVDRHVIAIAQTILERLKGMKMKPLNVEGLQTGDWVVIDCNHIMVHLFMPGIRDKYCLEELWRKAKIIPLSIDISPLK
ncbi:MAG: ribosome silencing factor [Chlamydiae bacterium]|nr:ribosome silencing factor [Chlamydiota bacterium]